MDKSNTLKMQRATFPVCGLHVDSNLTKAINGQIYYFYTGGFVSYLRATRLTIY